MYFPLALWILVLVNTAESLRQGQVILATMDRPYKKGGRPLQHLAIFLDYVQVNDWTMLQTAKIWGMPPLSMPSDRKVAFREIFAETVGFKKKNGEYASIAGEIDLKFSYPLPGTFSPLDGVILDTKEVENLKRKMDDFRVKQINSLRKGHLIWVVSRIMYGTGKKKPFNLAIVLDRTGLTMKIAQFSLGLPKSIPSDCRANLNNYFTDTFMPSRDEENYRILLQGEIDLRFHDVGPESISMLDVEVKFKPAEVNNLEVEMAKLESKCGKTTNQQSQQPSSANDYINAFLAQLQSIHGLPPVSYRPSERELKSLSENELIWVLSNVLYQKQELSAPYQWKSAIYLGPVRPGQWQDGLRIILFSQHFPYTLGPGGSANFEDFFPGTLFQTQGGPTIPFRGTIDFRIHKMPLRFIVISPDTDTNKHIFDPKQVRRLVNSITSWEAWLNGHAPRQRGGKQRRSLGNVTDINLPTLVDTIQRRGRA
ncbi:hypothetical protein APHAL10511_007697 [Amanita phalloides]|nr:hypothetical protein APHAL10511_007697 [Amanita phalloides]